MWAILVIFCLCWLPYQTYLMYQAFQTEENVTTKRIYMCVYWLAIANAAVNPLLFYRLDKQYTRKSIKDLFLHLTKLSFFEKGTGNVFEFSAEKSALVWECNPRGPHVSRNGLLILSQAIRT
jgi:hypothetical protein